MVGSANLVGAADSKKGSILMDIALFYDFYDHYSAIMASIASAMSSALGLEK